MKNTENALTIEETSEQLNNLFDNSSPLTEM